MENKELDRLLDESNELSEDNVTEFEPQTVDVAEKEGKELSDDLEPAETKSEDEESEDEEKVEDKKSEDEESKKDEESEDEEKVENKESKDEEEDSKEAKEESEKEPEDYLKEANDNMENIFDILKSLNEELSKPTVEKEAAEGKANLSNKDFYNAETEEKKEDVEGIVVEQFNEFVGALLSLSEEERSHIIDLLDCDILEDITAVAANLSESYIVEDDEEYDDEDDTLNESVLGKAQRNMRRNIKRAKRRLREISRNNKEKHKSLAEIEGEKDYKENKKQYEEAIAQEKKELDELISSYKSYKKSRRNELKTNFYTVEEEREHKRKTKEELKDRKAKISEKRKSVKDSKKKNSESGRKKEAYKKRVEADEKEASETLDKFVKGEEEKYDKAVNELKGSLRDYKEILPKDENKGENVKESFSDFELMTWLNENDYEPTIENVEILREELVKNPELIKEPETNLDNADIYNKETEPLKTEDVEGVVFESFSDFELMQFLNESNIEPTWANVEMLKEELGQPAIIVEDVDVFVDVLCSLDEEEQIDIIDMMDEDLVESVCNIINDRLSTDTLNEGVIRNVLNKIASPFRSKTSNRIQALKTKYLDRYDHNMTVAKEVAHSEAKGDKERAKRYDEYKKNLKDLRRQRRQARRELWKTDNEFGGEEKAKELEKKISDLSGQIKTTKAEKNKNSVRGAAKEAIKKAKEEQRIARDKTYTDYLKSQIKGYDDIAPKKKEEPKDEPKKDIPNDMGGYSDGENPNVTESFSDFELMTWLNENGYEPTFENVDLLREGLQNSDFYNSETEIKSEDVEGIIVEQCSDFELMTWLNENGYEPTMENVTILREGKILRKIARGAGALALIASTMLGGRGIANKVNDVTRNWADTKAAQAATLKDDFLTSQKAYDEMVKNNNDVIIHGNREEAKEALDKMADAEKELETKKNAAEEASKKAEKAAETSENISNPANTAGAGVGITTALALGANAIKKGMENKKKEKEQESGSDKEKNASVTESFSDLELMTWLDENGYEPTFENVAVLREGLENSDIYNKETEPEKAEDVKPVDQPAQKDKLDIEKSNEDKEYDVDKELPHAEKTAVVEPKDILKESVAYGSLKEALVLGTEYFAEDTYTLDTAEEKQAKLIEQVALSLGKESMDPIYDELLKSAVYTQRLQEALVNKYGKAAANKVNGLLGK